MLLDNDIKYLLLIVPHIYFRCSYNPQHYIRNRTIPYSPSVKYLGLTLDSKLTFKIHITKTINKTGALSVLYPLFKSYTLLERIKVILYMSMIRSMLLYGYEAWSILAHCHKNRVQILQNKYLKIIFDAPRYTRIYEIHDVAEIPYIPENIG